MYPSYYSQDPVQTLYDYELHDDPAYAYFPSSELSPPPRISNTLDHYICSNPETVVYNELPPIHDQRRERDLSEIPLFAPVPLPCISSLLSNPDSESPQFITGSGKALNGDLPYPALQSLDERFEPLSVAPSQKTFPTPCELLSELNQGANSNSTQAIPDNPESEKKDATAKKPRQHVIAQCLGFQPTNPESISPHEKKRSYMECLEHYIQFLHEQLHLVGTVPLKMDRFPEYRGLNSRSTRTLLVHMQDVVKKLHERTIAEEQEFVRLRQQVIALDEFDHQYSSATPDAMYLGSVSSPEGA